MPGMLSGALGGAAKGVYEVSKMNLEDIAAKRREQSAARLSQAGIDARAAEGKLDRESREKIAANKAAAADKKTKPHVVTKTEKDKRGKSTTSHLRVDADKGTTTRLIPTEELDTFNTRDKQVIFGVYDAMGKRDPEVDARKAYDQVIQRAPKLKDKLKFDTFQHIISNDLR